MEIQNNNLAFKAYFKNDSKGYFKRLYKISAPANQELVDKFSSIYPEHQLEIKKIELEWQKHLPKNIKYSILNHFTGETANLTLPNNATLLNDLLEKIVNSKELFIPEVWSNTFKQLIGK